MTINLKTLKETVTDTSLIGLVLIGAGSIMLAFSMWQLDMLLVSRMWGQASTNIQYYKDLIGNNYTSMSQMPWTINVELFPHMKAGEAYDVLMIMNFSSWFPLVAGAYLLHNKIVTVTDKIKKKLSL